MSGLNLGSNIAKLRTHRFSIDWTYDEVVEINLDDYAFFEADYRCDDWHLVGHKYDKETEKWSTRELSIHWCWEREIAEFIVQANAYADKLGFTRCRVSRFNNLHYSNGFYESLAKIFEAVKEIQAKSTRQEAPKGE